MAAPEHRVEARGTIIARGGMATGLPFPPACEQSAANPAGARRFAALIDACSKRAQPIVMTTIAMGAGMLPIALRIGADADFRAPIAIAVIGGLVTSTALSLFYVPVVFTFVDDAKRWLVRSVGQSRPADALHASESGAPCPAVRT